MNLKFVLEKYPGCLESRNRLKSVLTDLYADSRRTVNMLVAAYEYGIPEQLKRMEELDRNRLSVMASGLAQEYGLQEPLAVQAVLTWAEAMDRLRDPELKKMIRSDGGDTPLYGEVRGSGDVFRLEQKEDGWIITSYQGPDQRELTVPNSVDGHPVSGIGPEAFAGMEHLESLVLSEGIGEIGSSAFSACGKLKSIQFPRSLKTLGTGDAKRSRGVFDCTAVEELDLPGGLQYIGVRAFLRCGNLRRVTMGAQVREIGREAFAFCTSLTDLSLSTGLEIIREEAFKGCTALREVRLPDRVRRLEGGAFYFDPGLEKLWIPPGVTEIGPREKFTTDSIVTDTSRLAVCCAPGSPAMRYANTHGLRWIRTSF